MKLNELFDMEPVVTKQDYYTYDDEIKKKYDQLGGGTFANVYKSKVAGKTYAVKVINAGGSAGPKQDALLNFYVRCAEFPNNPYLPKIYDIRSYKYFNKRKNFGHRGWNMMYIVHMEKLKELPNNIDKSPYGNVYNALEDYFNNDSRAPKEAALALMRRDPSLKQAVQLINSVKRKFGAEVDYHQNNVMLRGSQVVLTDPFCN